MGDGGKRPSKYEYLWHAILGACRVVCYDFQLYKKSHPPIADPQVVYPEKFKRELPPDE